MPHALSVALDVLHLQRWPVLTQYLQEPKMQAMLARRTASASSAVHVACSLPVKPPLSWLLRRPCDLGLVSRLCVRARRKAQTQGRLGIRLRTHWKGCSLQRARGWTTGIGSLTLHGLRLQPSSPTWPASCYGSALLLMGTMRCMQRQSVRGFTRHWVKPCAWLATQSRSKKRLHPMALQRSHLPFFLATTTLSIMRRPA
mmetsp:Transcript_15106/g.31592  ORF Transcript_15106/g.31592 Transcript_15106/m.31592 type:complete len:200 (-) Transcript_15106:82-681(-)